MPNPQTALPMSDLWKIALNTIQAVEAAYPEGGKGKEKFDIVYTQVMAFAPLVSIGLSLLEAALPIFINSAVSIFNTIGKFTTSKPPATAG